MSLSERSSPAMPLDWYYHVLESLPLIVYCVDATPPYAPRYISRGIEALGYTREEWLETPDRWLRSIHPDDREEVLRASRAASEARSFLEIEYRVAARDGGTHWIQDRGEFASDADGPVLWRGVMMDVTARKDAELALRDSQRQYGRCTTSSTRPWRSSRPRSNPPPTGCWWWIAAAASCG